MGRFRLGSRGTLHSGLGLEAGLGVAVESVFIYWDNSNIFHEAQRLAPEHDDGPDARYRV